MEKVHKVYSALFAIHQGLRLGEEYELVLAGLAYMADAYRPESVTGCRRRHLGWGRGKFTVRPHTEGAKLRPELDMLDIEEQPARAEETAKSSLGKAEDNPWEKGCIEGVLQALVHSINSQGDYEDSLEAKSIRASTKPIVDMSCLILRVLRRVFETLKRIKEQTKRQGHPRRIRDLAEIRPKDNRDKQRTGRG